LVDFHFVLELYCNVFGQSFVKTPNADRKLSDKLVHILRDNTFKFRLYVFLKLSLLVGSPRCLEFMENCAVVFFLFQQLRSLFLHSHKIVHICIYLLEDLLIMFFVFSRILRILLSNLMYSLSQF
jgi:hypothetical protein